MSTLIYSPGIRVIIDTDTWGPINVTDDLVSGNLRRVENGVSSFNFVLANPNRKYDRVFTPNDRIAVQMKRIRWLQLYVGYLDSVPYFTAWARSVSLSSSCSLKRMQFFPWDPYAEASAGLLNSVANTGVSDGGMRERAEKLLTEVVGWDENKIHIGEVPTEWFEKIDALYGVVQDSLVFRDGFIVGDGPGGVSLQQGIAGMISGGAGQTKDSIPGNPATGTLPHSRGKISGFGGPGDASMGTGKMALSRESGARPGIPEDPQGLWYCLPGDTPIYTPTRGPVVISEVKEGDEVWAVEEGKPVVRQVTGHQHTGRKPIWEIKTLNHCLRSSPEHRVLTLTRDGTRKTRREVVFEWREAQDVQQGDVIVAAGSLPSGEGDHPDEETARLVGMLVGDGTRGDYAEDGPGSATFSLCAPHALGPKRDEIISFIEKTLQVKVGNYSYSCCLRFSHRGLRRWTWEVMGKKSSERFVPPWVWGAPIAVQKAFIQGYMEADGSLQQKAKTQGTQVVNCASPRLASEMRALCHYVGYRTTNLGCSKRSTNGYGETPFSWRFCFYTDTTRTQVPTSYARTPLGLDPHLVARTVTSSRATGETVEMWDIEVEGAENFIADGVVVHNCAMRWPYVQSLPYRNRTHQLRSDLTTAQVNEAMQWWNGQRILVSYPESGRAVVLRAADWGPAEWTGRVIDVAPNVYRALEVSTDDTVNIAFAPEGAPLGRVEIDRAAEMIDNAGNAVKDFFGKIGNLATGSGSSNDRLPGPGAHQQTSPATSAQGLTTKEAPSSNTPFPVPSGVGNVRANDMAWGGYSNGEIPLSKMSTFTSATGTFRDYMHPIAAEAWRMLASEARKAGFTIDGGAYRTLQRQREVAGPRAATPGTSNHGWGLAIDINGMFAPAGSQTTAVYSTARYRWLAANASRFGWVNPPWAQQGGNLPEPWHWEFWGIFNFEGEGGLLPSGTPSGGGGGEGTTNGLGAGGPLFNAAYWEQQINPESMMLGGPLALINDEPVMRTLGVLMNAAGRSYCSAPNGDFIAWFPDYFGAYGTAGRLIVEPIELLDFTVDWSDLRLKTHQFVTGALHHADGPTTGPGGPVAVYSKMMTHGVASIEYPELMDALFNLHEDSFFNDAKALLRRFGARHEHKTIPTIAGHEAEFWYALFLFQRNWAEQFLSKVPTTFLPEAYPGMLMQIPELDFQAYIQEVTHNFNFADGGGFTTTLDITAPASLSDEGLMGLPRAQGAGTKERDDGTGSGVPN